MRKKEYMKPAIQIVELKHRTTILAGSPDIYDMNKELVTDFLIGKLANCYFCGAICSLFIEESYKKREKTARFQ